MALPFGIDVSRYQTSQDGLKHFDWNKAKSAGVSKQRPILGETWNRN